MFLERVKQLNVRFVLNNHELRQDLSTGIHIDVVIQACPKAALTVNEAGYPLRVQIHQYSRT
jgi:hypothetical protein